MALNSTMSCDIYTCTICVIVYKALFARYLLESLCFEIILCIHMLSNTENNNIIHYTGFHCCLLIKCLSKKTEDMATKETNCIDYFGINLSSLWTIWK